MRSGSARYWSRDVAREEVEAAREIIAASGVETDGPAGCVFRFRDGKLLRFRAFRDPEQALEAVGLPE